MTGSYDPELNLLYWGTGNPGPDYDGTVREGDNLYSDSVVALDADTGEMKWYFQFTPHDIHDWDSTQVPVLADAEFNGEERKLMLFPNRNAFFYVLDRETGEFLLGEPYARQTWAEGLDENGRPILVPGMEPSPEGTVVSPAITGGSNWWSPSYSPRTGLIYVMAYDAATRYFIRPVEYQQGQSYRAGGGESPEPLENYVRACGAIEPQTGDLRWEFPVDSRTTSGLLSTAGDLVFGGTADGFFFRARRRYRRGVVVQERRRGACTPDRCLCRGRPAARGDRRRQRRLRVRGARTGSCSVAFREIPTAPVFCRQDLDLLF